MHARNCVRLYYDWIATVAMLPRDDKTGKRENKKIKHHTQFPSMEGCRAAAGWSEGSRMPFLSVPGYAPTHTPLSLRAKRSNPVNYAPRVCADISQYTGSPRSRCSLAMTKSTTPSSPLWRGAAQRRGGQRVQECLSSLSPGTPPPTHLCHCE